MSATIVEQTDAGTTLGDVAPPADVALTFPSRAEAAAAFGAAAALLRTVAAARYGDVSPEALPIYALAAAVAHCAESQAEIDEKARTYLVHMHRYAVTRPDGTVDGAVCADLLRAYYAAAERLRA